MISDECPECEADHIDMQALTFNKVGITAGHCLIAALIYDIQLTASKQIYMFTPDHKVSVHFTAMRSTLCTIARVCQTADSTNAQWQDRHPVPQSRVHATCTCEGAD